MQLQLVIFDFEEQATGTKHVAIATSKCVPSGIFRRLQHLCPSTSYGLVSVFLNDFFSDHMHFKGRNLFGNVDTGLEICCSGLCTLHTAAERAVPAAVKN